jgi:hypothetical protein
MRALLVLLVLGGCAEERKLAQSDPILVSGAIAVFVGAAAGMLK